DLPETVQWLTNSEKELLTNRLRRDNPVPTLGEVKFSWHQIKNVFIDLNVYIYAFIYFGNITSANFLSLYLPSIIKTMGYSEGTAQLLSVPPYVLACFTTIIVSFIAGRRNERGYHIGLFLFISIIGYILLITLTAYNSIALYLIICITCTSTYTTITLILSWCTSNVGCGSRTKRAVAICVVIGFGNISGILTPYVSCSQSYTRGNIISLIFMCCSFLVVLLLKLRLKYENRRRQNLTREQYISEESLATDLSDL
ncbi:unnamed protein product, partial [Didymodactylos carnosus]